MTLRATQGHQELRGGDSLPVFSTPKSHDSFKRSTLRRVAPKVKRIPIERLTEVLRTQIDHEAISSFLREDNTK